MVSPVEPVLIRRRAIVAPITRTVRGIPTEIPLGVDEGLDVDCATSFDNLGPQPVAMLSGRIGRLQDPRTRICAALSGLPDRWFSDRRSRPFSGRGGPRRVRNEFCVVTTVGQTKRLDVCGPGIGHL